MDAFDLRRQEIPMPTTTEPAAPPLNLHEYETAARALLSPMVFDFVAGGTGDEVTLRACRAAFARWRLLPRVLRGLPPVTTATTVLGQEIASPVLIAPTSLHRLVHDDGELATARAARAAGTIYTMSTPATIPIEAVAPEAGPWWFQLYVFVDRGLTRDLVARAAAAGATALVVTVDMPVLGRREADERNRFALPPGLAMANLRAPESAPVAASGSRLTSYASVLEPALTWADLDWLAGLSPLPVVPKGILHPADAILAVDHGAQALIVSNHGGRQLDGAIAALDALPAIVAAVAGQAEVLLDGGVRRGTDVLTALALGARAVLIGRPIHWGLAVGGEAGVRHVLELLQTELARDLLLCGLASPVEADRSFVVRAEVPMAEAWP
jgi:4-hydroxymandelate oxidase